MLNYISKITQSNIENSIGKIKGSLYGNTCKKRYNKNGNNNNDNNLNNLNENELLNTVKRRIF